MAGPYCTVDRMFDIAVPRGTIVEPARQVASVAGDRLVIDSNGLTLNKPFTLRVGPGGVLPTPLVAGTVYYAKPVTGAESLVEVSATVDGSAITLTDEGTAPFLIVLSYVPAAEAALRYTARMIDRHLPAHVVPLTEPYPDEIEAMNAFLAAGNLAKRLGLNIPTIAAMADSTANELKDVLRGMFPLRDVAATEPANTAESWSNPPRGWGRGRIP